MLFRDLLAIWQLLDTCVVCTENVNHVLTMNKSISLIGLDHNTSYCCAWLNLVWSTLVLIEDKRHKWFNFFLSKYSALWLKCPLYSSGIQCIMPNKAFVSVYHLQDFFKIRFFLILCLLCLNVFCILFKQKINEYIKTVWSEPLAVFVWG